MNVFFFVAAVCVGVSLAFLTAFFVVSGCVGFCRKKLFDPSNYIRRIFLMT